MDKSSLLLVFGIIALCFAIVVIALIFGSYNKKVLKKSYMDTRIFMYVMPISCVFFISAIFYTKSISTFSVKTYLIYYAMFLLYAILLMAILIATLKPLKKIDLNIKELAKGRKNLQFNFEGAEEFESIAKSLGKVQQNYRNNDKKLNQKDNIYQRYIPKQYLKFFGKKSVNELKVGDHAEVKLCTMFCDMRNSFYSSETLSLDDNFKVISEFLQTVSQSVRKHGGFVDKFMGDGVVAIFENEDNALCCANETAKQLDYKNIVSIGKEPIRFGIALNSGMCVVGVVGDEKQKQFSVVSDVVNVCGRIEKVNKLFYTRVLFTKSFLSTLKDNFLFRYVGSIKFDDLTNGIPLFESLDAYEDSKKLVLQKYIADFESGVRFYEKAEFDKAKQYFSACIKQNNSDTLAKLYLSKTMEEMQTKLPYKTM